MPRFLGLLILEGLLDKGYYNKGYHKGCYKGFKGFGFGPRGGLRVWGLQGGFRASGLR